MTRNRIFHVLVIYLIINGCGVTDPDYTNDILPILLDYPEITYPIQTTGNASNPGYLATVVHLDDICAQRNNMIRYLIQPFVDDGIVGKKEGAIIEWRRIRDNHPDRFTVLSVTRGDTLRYRVDYEGPDSGGYWVSGWFIPSSGDGYVVNSGNWSCRWWSTTKVLRLAVDNGDWLALGYTHEVADSLNGSGSMRWKYPYESERYAASWDADGHGSWTSSAEGSGEW